MLLFYSYWPFSLLNFIACYLHLLTFNVLDFTLYKQENILLAMSLFFNGVLQIFQEKTSEKQYFNNINFLFFEKAVFSFQKLPHYTVEAEQPNDIGYILLWCCLCNRGEDVGAGYSTLHIGSYPSTVHIPVQYSIYFLALSVFFFPSFSFLRYRPFFLFFLRVLSPAKTPTHLLPSSPASILRFLLLCPTLHLSPPRV